MKTASNNWNYERWRTRDRLLEYDGSIMPLYPHSGGIAVPYPREGDIPLTIPELIHEAELKTVYPWENYSLNILAHQLYLIARDNGFSGTEKYFIEKFSSNDTANEKDVIVGTIETFPREGNENILYLDKETSILYYFKHANSINEQAIQDTASVITGFENNIYFIYIPVRALLLEDTILNCEDASEYIG